MTATVSVVIPTFERPKFLSGAIETALNQTQSDLEIVVVDDGSTRSYAKDIVAKYPGWVHCVNHDENRGLSAARNTGIRESEGKYVAFLDDDDRWHKTKLTRQVDAMERSEGAGLTTCLVTAISPENKIIHCETDASSGDCSDQILIGNCIGTPSRILVRRECLDDVGGFDESLPTKQDWDFYIRACQNWKVVAVENHLCFRTVHESMSSSPKSTKQDNSLILEKHEELIRERGYWHQARAEVAERVARAFLQSGDLKSARKHLENSFSLQPTKRRGLLFLLTFTHPKVVKSVITVKRILSLRVKGCSTFDVPTQIVTNQ
jgi:glycosyltransferase involved in cell wall biosynthesis